MAYRIVVPLDGSILADQAIPLADLLAGELEAGIELVSVRLPGHAAPLSPLLPDPLLFRAHDTGEAEGIRQSLSVASPWFFRAKSVKASILEGDPAAAIAAYAQQSAANLTGGGHCRLCAAVRRQPDRDGQPWLGRAPSFAAR
jgi:nucleotide-binding universal stress UspA family protein